jgi:hypothetical protein
LEARIFKQIMIFQQFWMCGCADYRCADFWF